MTTSRSFFEKKLCSSATKIGTDGSRRTVPSLTDSTDPELPPGEQDDETKADNGIPARITKTKASPVDPRKRLPI
jgi:hypothetical protein